MKRRNAIVLVAVMAFVTSLSVRGVLAATVPINLLPLGDSITEQGYYINPLVTDLTNAGYAPTVIANEGHSGYIIDGSIPGAPRPGLAENIGVGHVPDFLNHPNVNASNTFILLMIGTNDVDTGFQLSTSQVQSRMSGLISKITTEAPLAHLIVAKIVPNLGSAAKDAAVVQFNSDIAGVTTGTNVSMVDMYSAFQPNPSQYMGDSLHPNPNPGGTKMAEVWLGGIQAVPEPGIAAAGIILGAAAMLHRRQRSDAPVRCAL